MPTARTPRAAPSSSLAALLLAATGLSGAAAVRGHAGASARTQQQAWGAVAALDHSTVPRGVASNTSTQVIHHSEGPVVRLLAKASKLAKRDAPPDAVSWEGSAGQEELVAESSAQDTAAAAAEGALSDDASAIAAQDAELEAQPPAAPSEGLAVDEGPLIAAAVDPGHAQFTHIVEEPGQSDTSQGEETDAPVDKEKSSSPGDRKGTPKDQQPEKALLHSNKDGEADLPDDENGEQSQAQDIAKKVELDEDETVGNGQTQKDATQVEQAKQANQEEADKAVVQEASKKEDEKTADEGEDAAESDEADHNSGKNSGSQQAAVADETSLDREIQKQLRKDKKLASQQKAMDAKEGPIPEDRLLRRKVGRLEGSIARETGSLGLAEMLAGMKMDMFRLRDKVEDLERTIQDGVRLEAVPADDHVVYPLSGCMRCILILTGLYFLIYTSAGASKVFVDVFSLGENTKTELSLRAACNTVFYAPMICVLFLGAHLRSAQISEGAAGPGEAAELAMQACTWSVIVQTVLVLLVPVLTGEVVLVDEETGLELPHIQDTTLAGILALIRYAAMAGLFLGVGVVCAQAVLMDTRSLGVRPLDRWDDSTTAAIEYAPPVSAAMSCTMWLTGLFFAVHMLRSALRTCLEFSSGGVHGASREGHRSGAREFAAHWEQCLQVCAHATSPAPMLCILFMAARMRALQLDPKSGRPQGWAELCFYESSVAVAVHTAVIFLAKALGIKAGAGPCGGGEPEGSEAGGQEPAPAPLVERLVLYVRIIAVLTVCWGFLGVISSMLVVHIPSDPSGKPIPAVPPALLCVFTFAAMYFAVYVCVFLSQAFAVTSFSLGVASEGSAYLLQTVHVLQVAEHSVQLCPMLSVLFVGTWLRAELLGGPRAALPCWARDAMCVAVGALSAQLLLALAGGGEAAEPGAGPGRKPRRAPAAAALLGAKALSFGVLYGSLAVVGFSVLVIRPETAVCEA